MDHLISVIVPHHNRPILLGEAIASIQSQTVKPLEIIVVDDCSRPEDRAALARFSGVARILDTPRQLGISATRNFGAAAAKGEWLCFLDDDDIYLPEKLERQSQYLTENPSVEALGCALTMITPDGKKEHWGGTYTGQVSLASALYYTAAMSQSLMIRRDVFLELGGFSPAFRHLEDYEFGIRLAASKHRLDFIGEALFLYRRGGREQLSAQWGKMFAAEMKVLRTHSDLLRQEFGHFGPMRMYARCLKRCGRRAGKLLGRSAWALGCVVEGVCGRQIGQYDY